MWLKEKDDEIIFICGGSPTEYEALMKGTVAMYIAALIGKLNA